MKTTHMSGKERVLAALGGCAQDRLAVTPLVGHYAATLTGYSLKEFTLDPHIMARCLVDAQQRLGYDAIYVSSDTWINAQALGCEMVFPDDAPAYGRPILSERSELSRLCIPDPGRDGRFPLMLKALTLVREALGDTVCVIGCMDQSPLSLASQLRGATAFLFDLVDTPDFARKLLAFCSEVIVDYGLALAERGADVLNTGDSVAGLIGPEMYKEFALPYQQDVFERLSKTGKPTVLHICGDVTNILDLMAESNAAGFEIDHEVNLSYALDVMGDRACVIGNLDPIGLLLNGTAVQVKASVQRCLLESAGYSRYILASGCVISPGTPAENVMEMVRATQDSGGRPKASGC